MAQRWSQSSTGYLKARTSVIIGVYWRYNCRGSPTPRETREPSSSLVGDLLKEACITRHAVRAPKTRAPKKQHPCPSSTCPETVGFSGRWLARVFQTQAKKSVAITTSMTLGEHGDCTEQVEYIGATQGFQQDYLRAIGLCWGLTFAFLVSM